MSKKFKTFIWNIGYNGFIVAVAKSEKDAKKLLRADESYIIPAGLNKESLEIVFKTRKPVVLESEKTAYLPI